MLLSGKRLFLSLRAILHPGECSIQLPAAGQQAGERSDGRVLEQLRQGSLLAEQAGQFIAGWLTEYSLSIDNLFVFVVIMARFAVPKRMQQEVLMVGIILALIFRGIFILIGAQLIEAFSWIFYLFGALAEFERDIIRERTQAGLQAATAPAKGRARLCGRRGP